jgi:hypothetical protein
MIKAKQFKIVSHNSSEIKQEKKSEDNFRQRRTASFYSNSILFCPINVRARIYG